MGGMVFWVNVSPVLTKCSIKNILYTIIAYKPLKKWLVCLQADNRKTVSQSAHMQHKLPNKCIVFWQQWWHLRHLSCYCVFVECPHRFHLFCNQTFVDNKFINIIFNYIPTKEIRNDFEQCYKSMLYMYTTATVLYDIVFDDH